MTLTVLRIAGPLIAGYLLGGIPFGVVIARTFYRLDITKLGSGNTGGTNVYRNLGWKAGLAVAVLDVGKAAVPTLLALALADPAWGTDARDWLGIGAGLAAVAGHSYSPYFRLRGGKGVATAGGSLIVLMPLVAAVEFPLFALSVAVVRIVSVASLVVATALPLLVRLIYPGRPALLVFASAAAILVWWRHRTNIARLLKGEEPRIGRGGLSLKGAEALSRDGGANTSSDAATEDDSRDDGGAEA